MNLSNTIWSKISFVVILYSSLFPSNLYGRRQILSSELVSSSGKLNVHPKSDLCLISYQEVCPPFGGTTVYVYPWKGGMSAHTEETFFCPQKRRGVCLPLAKAGPSLEQQEAKQVGAHTYPSTFPKQYDH